jgi:hypothetical protein
LQAKAVDYNLNAMIQPENLKFTSESFADIVAARDFGYSRMGERAFLGFVSELKSEEGGLILQIINGRLRLGGSKNNVHIAAAVTTAEELALVEAALLWALENKDVNAGLVLTSGLGEMPPDTKTALELMRIKIFSEDNLAEDLTDHTNNQPRTMLLVSPPSVLPEELSQTRFAYRWNIHLDTNSLDWDLGEVETVSKQQ